MCKCRSLTVTGALLNFEGISRGNAKWPFGLSKMGLYSGGWIRQQNGALGVVIPSMSFIDD